MRGAIARGVSSPLFDVTVESAKSMVERIAIFVVVVVVDVY